MSFLKKSIGLLTFFAVIPMAYAVTARPSVTNAAAAISRRLPTLTAYMNSTTSGGDTSGGDTSNGDTSSGTMNETECVDTYTECMRASDACGPDFEECTNKKLFHGQMPKCLSILAQCPTDGVYALFGTKLITELGDGVTSTSTDGAEYTYPASGSAMAQWISAAAINNQYDTATCIKRYTTCLHKDSVCGADFELCTNGTEFKKQALLCDSTLARCQSAAKYELFGEDNWTPYTTQSKTIGGRIGAMITDGANLAAMNAVSTCYRVTEQCFLGACAANPLRCIEGSSIEAVLAGNAASETAGTQNETPVNDRNGNGITDTADINNYLKSACFSTIGTNKYCHMTYREKSPSDADLKNEDLQEEVFDDAVSQRKPYVMSKITGLMQDFDKRTKDKCVDTIRACAMRTCGEGVGSVCYTQVFSDSGQGTINGNKTYDHIKAGCAAIVNSDVNCRYAYASIKEPGSDYSYSYVESDAFTALFPRYSTQTPTLKPTGATQTLTPTLKPTGAMQIFDTSDPLGAVASLNASLAQNYNAAAIANMKKQCQTVARNCVKSLCGTDYVNCYRNRTDIVSDLTKTDTPSFDNSMNKVGGVLDYTIVLGLCMDTVKNAKACDEHLKITAARFKTDTDKNPSWGTDSVRSDWVDAGGSKTVVGIDAVQKVDENNKELCTNVNGDECPCGDFKDQEVCDEPVYTTLAAYQETQAANTLFKELITDIEYEAQALYNAKLTKQQNMCLSENNGGILGTADRGSVYSWVKLKSGRVPRDYSVNGLSANDTVASNDLYGSFCRVRVTLQSDDPAIQQYLSKSGASISTAYFAAGDAFTCGSWIGATELEKLAQAAGKAAREKATFEWEKDGSNNWYWMMLPTIVGGGIGGAYLAEGINTGDVFGGLTGNTKQTSDKELCEKYADRVMDNLTKSKWSDAIKYFKEANKHVKASSKVSWPLEGKYPDDAHCSVGGKTESDYDSNTFTKTDPSGCKCGDKEVNYGTICVGDMTLNSAKGLVQTAVNELKDACDGADETMQYDKEKDGNGQGWGGFIGAATAGALTFAVIQSAREGRLDGAELEAYNAFYEEVGQHIQCYIGGEPAGSFGDVVVTSME